VEHAKYPHADREADEQQAWDRLRTIVLVPLAPVWITRGRGRNVGIAVKRRRHLCTSHIFQLHVEVGSRRKVWCGLYVDCWLK
jgi:hypothetical protein